MSDAVIVDAVRTPIGRAVKGSLKDVRADDLAAIPLRALLERNPAARPRHDRRRDDGRGLGRGRAGLQRRPQRADPRRLPGLRARHDRQPLLRLLAADDPHGLPRDPRGRGRHVRRRRRRGRLAARRGLAGAVPPAARRVRGLARQRLHPDGPDGRERRRARGRHARGAGPLGRDLAEPRRAGAGVGPLRRGDRAGRRARAHRARRAGQRGHRGRGDRHEGRRPAPGHELREALAAETGLQARRHGHGRQRLPAQRRRRRGADHVRGEGAGARA